MEPAAQVKWAAWDSSKYCYAILKIFECVVAGDRLLIYVQSPITSQILNALLVVCGIRSLHYMSRNSQAERDAAVEHFNDSSSPYTVLITSMQLAAFGVNFHKACHRGLIMESVSNLSTEVQATGRTWRIGQMYKVVWKRLICADYYDCDRRVWVRASILLDNQDLAIICQEPGIDVRSLRVNPYDPKMVAKPPQVLDVYRIAQLLQGPIHFAMLLNECGTGKTFTAALAMSFLIQDKVTAARARPPSLAEGKRIFKPSIMFIPADWLLGLDLVSSYRRIYHKSQRIARKHLIDFIG
ncbi:P-loop containing nucleoside triphosphate hydrolase protein [Ilyonectria robusta]|uniref:P-loop containing nucleoside triphosphate hydrolase protein n=1 Tax=Ilyonectria robusta TaxID=1079257 RepID=UPI001E8D4608|nr:P-loop containing nucleoside triphosphate hydrolase protein [Ilyonectria robusta]KAH8729722.1 P-loop containing nucleoside triphosphate hydrolase protein [Ilyonectria robusta]